MRMYRQQGYTIIELSPSIDPRKADQEFSGLRFMIQQRGGIYAVDMEKVRLLGEGHVRMLSLIHQHIGAIGGEVCIVNAGDTVREALRFSQVSRFIRMFGSLVEFTIEKSVGEQKKHGGRSAGGSMQGTI
jgi:anti-anti-sigma regulatory factor